MTMTQERQIAPGAALDAPRATRSRRSGWRSPRLLLGSVLVAGSVLLGAWTVSAADDTVGVWAVSRDLPAGASIGPADLEVRRIRFPDAATADQYLPSGDQPPQHARLAHAVSSGELLARAALDTGSGPDLVEVPISVAPEDLPATVRQGAHVDVWVSPDVSAVGAGKVRARRVLENVAVIEVPRSAGSLAPETTRQVIVGVEPDRTEELGRALGAISEGRAVIARVG